MPSFPPPVPFLTSCSSGLYQNLLLSPPFVLSFSIFFQCLFISFIPSLRLILVPSHPPLTFLRLLLRGLPFPNYYSASFDSAQPYQFQRALRRFPSPMKTIRKARTGLPQETLLLGAFKEKSPTLPPPTPPLRANN